MYRACYDISMIIRSVTNRDYASVKHLIENMKNAVFEDDSFRTAFEYQQNDPRFHAFVCENGGMVLAFVNLRIDYQIHHAAKVAEIMELVTKEDCRGQGIGRELFRHACQFAREEGCVQIELNSSFRRTDAHRFYESVGMRKDHFNFTMPLQ